MTRWDGEYVWKVLGMGLPKSSPRGIDVALICAKANDATTRTAHEFYEAILANLYDLAYSTSETVPFGDRSYFTLRHS